jgi:hypothetical protein
VTDTGQRVGASAERRAYDVAEPSAWTAWVLFAGIIMIMVGMFHALSGLVALFEDDYYVVGPEGLVINVDYTAWGWTHLLLGILVFAVGCGAMVGQTWARTVGVVLAVISAVTNMVFIAAYPIWSILIITLDVVVIYALVVHGRELKDA